MDTDSKLNAIMVRCKCGVSLEVNEHRSDHNSAFTALDDARAMGMLPEDLSGAVFKKMIETDTIIVLHFYPETPIGFYRLYHYDLDGVLDQAMAILEEDQRQGG